MNVFVLALFAIGYSGVVLFLMAHSLKKLFPPTRAAWLAFGISAGVHSLTMIFLESERVLPVMALWGVPHLLLLPVLLYAARRETKGTSN